MFRQYGSKTQQEALSHCDIFSQRVVERIDRTYNKRFLIETLSEQFQPLFFVLFFDLYFSIIHCRDEKIEHKAVKKKWDT